MPSRRGLSYQLSQKGLRSGSVAEIAKSPPTASGRAFANMAIRP